MEQYLTASEQLHRRFYKVCWYAYDNQITNKVQLPFRIIELISSETCRMSKIDFRQNKNILPSGSFAEF